MSAGSEALHLRIFGDGGKPLLLLHPIATRGDIWDLQVPVLACDRQVIVPDLPGHGKSKLLHDGANVGDYARAVLEAIENLGLPEVDVVGLSFGGMVAQAIALASPQKVRRLVLAHCGAVTPSAVVEMWRQRLEEATEFGMSQQVSSTLHRWFTPDFRQRASATCAWVAEMIANTPIEGYAAAVQAICRLNHTAQLGGLPMPALVIGGALDQAVPLATSETMAGLLSHGEFIALADAAHLGNVEKSTQFTEMLHTFLR